MSYERSDIDKVKNDAAARVTDLGSAKPVSALQSQFKASSSNPFNDGPDKDAEKPIYPTDVMKVDCKLPQLDPVPKLDVNQKVSTPPPDAQPLRKQHDTAVTNYLQADQKIKGTFIEALKKQDLQVGQALENMIPSVGGTSPAIETLKAMDPGLSDIYNALNDKGNKNTKNPRVAEALDKTLNSLHQAYAAQKAAHTENPAKVPPPEIDWTKFKTSQQVMNFMTRNVENDPFMKQAEKVDLNIKVREENVRVYKEEYLKGEGKFDFAKLEEAFKSGDEGRVATMVGQETAQIIKQTGDIQLAMKKELSIDDFAIRMDVGSLGGMKVGKNIDQNDVTGFSARTREVAEMLLRNEPPREMRMAATPMASA
jgi:hypothetical protein